MDPETLNLVDLAAFRPPPPRPDSQFVEPEWEETPDGAESELRKVGRCTIRGRYVVETVGIQEASAVLAGRQFELIHRDDAGVRSPERVYSIGDWLLRLPPRVHQARLIEHTRDGLPAEQAAVRLERELCEAGGRLDEWCGGVLFLGTLELDLIWNTDVIATVTRLGLLSFHDSVTDAESRAARWVLRDLAPRLFREGTAFVREQDRQRPRRARSCRRQPHGMRGPR